MFAHSEKKISRGYDYAPSCKWLDDVTVKLVRSERDIAALPGDIVQQDIPSDRVEVVLIVEYHMVVVAG